MTKKLIQYQCSVCDEIHETEQAADECCVVKIDEKFEAFKIAAKEVSESATHPKELFERAEKLIQEYTDSTTFELTYTSHYRKRESYKDSIVKDVLGVEFTIKKHPDLNWNHVIPCLVIPLFGIGYSCGNGDQEVESIDTQSYMTKL